MTESAGGARATVELRSVNHRFLDLKLRTGPQDAGIEDRIGAALRKRVERGSFVVSIRREGGGGSAGVQVDAEAARAAVRALEMLRDLVGTPEPIPLALVAAQPGVLSTGDSGMDVDAAWAAVEPALEKALGQLITMREAEGATLAADIAARLDRLESFAAAVASHAATAPEEWRRRLEERLSKLSTGIEPARLAAEVAILADRLDVTEELVRLRSHIGQVRNMLGQSAPVGRRLDFLVQELGREVNTIGSKSQSAEIAHRVVEAKAELEKIREQIQNVE